MTDLVGRGRQPRVSFGAVSCWAVSTPSRWLVTMMGSDTHRIAVPQYGVEADSYYDASKCH